MNHRPLEDSIEGNLAHLLYTRTTLNFKFKVKYFRFNTISYLHCTWIIIILETLNAQYVVSATMGSLDLNKTKRQRWNSFMMLCSGVGSWEFSLSNNHNCLRAIESVVNNKLAIGVVHFTDFLTLWRMAWTYRLPQCRQTDTNTYSTPQPLTSFIRMLAYFLDDLCRFYCAVAIGKVLLMYFDCKTMLTIVYACLSGGCSCHCCRWTLCGKIQNKVLVVFKIFWRNVTYFISKYIILRNMY